MRPPCIETVTALALLAVPAAPAQQPLVTRPLDSASVVRLHLVEGSRIEAELVTTFAPESGVIVYRPPFHRDCGVPRAVCQFRTPVDRKSTRLNSSHGYISYAVFCLKKKKKKY